MPAGTLEVFLIGATGIKDTEIFGKADPYAVLLCGKQKLRSNTASNQGSKPVWNQKFSFYIDDTATELQIRIFNHNILKEDDEIGSTLIPLAKAFAEGKLLTTSYNVVRPSGRVQGEVKLSITFSPKHKPGQQTPQNVPGPYSQKIHGSPYAATPPEPKVKHDPLTGPHGYFKNNSSVSDSSSSLGSSHGGFYSVGTGPNLGDSNHGSSPPYPPAASDAYPPNVYPPVAPSPYNRTNTSSTTYQKVDSFSDSMYGSSSGRLYGAPSTSSDYAASVHQHSPYVQYPYTSAITHSLDAGHGSIPMSSSASPYPASGVPSPSFSSVPSKNSSNGMASQYNRFEELAGNFAGLNVSGDDSSHGSYPGYQRTSSSFRDKPPSGYPPTGTDGNYPGYNPHTSTSHDRPLGGYPPSAYQPLGYPSQVDNHDDHFSHTESVPSHYGYQAPPPPSSYYPSHIGIHEQGYGRTEAGGPPLSSLYPPVPFYNSPSAKYTPAGYPKSGVH